MPGDRKFSRKNGKSVNKNELRSVVRSMQETKHKTFETGFADIGSVSGTLVELSSIGQGTGDGARVGNQINVQKIYVQKILKMQVGASNAQCAVRVLLIQSRGGSLSTSDMPTFFAAADLDKFIIYKDRLVNLSTAVITLAPLFEGTSVMSRVVWKIPRKKIYKQFLTYDDATVTPRNAPIYLYMLAENADGQQAGFETLYYKDS